MSKIIDKAFDAGKKIIRSVFKGSPNLFTTSDLNRQFESMKHQMDLLDEKTGFHSDISVDAGWSGKELIVNYSYSFMEFKGCRFSPEVETKTLHFSAQHPFETAYLVLLADIKTVDYNSDSTHEISGAKFADGTSYPASDSIVYENERIDLFSAIPDNAVGVLAEFSKTSGGKVIVKVNALTGQKSSLLNIKDPMVEELSNDRSLIKVGDSYETAISKLQNRLNYIKNDRFSGWTLMNNGGIMNNLVSFRMTDGVLNVKIPQTNARCIPSRNGEKYMFLAGFPEDAANFILNYISKLGITTSDTNGVYLIIGNLGTSWASRTDNGSIGSGSIGILMQLAIGCVIDGESNFSDVGLYAFPVCVMDGTNDTSSEGKSVFNGQPLYGWTQEYTLHTNSTIGTIPFTGFNW